MSDSTLLPIVGVAALTILGLGLFICITAPWERSKPPKKYTNFHYYVRDDSCKYLWEPHKYCAVIFTVHNNKQKFLYTTQYYESVEEATKDAETIIKQFQERQNGVVSS